MKCIFIDLFSFYIIHTTTIFSLFLNEHKWSFFEFDEFTLNDTSSVILCWHAKTCFYTVLW